jgi:hypothetical protein
MRLLKVTLVLCVLLSVMTPVRAHAWFGVLDRLSGPGPFYGALYDVRVACLGRAFTEPDALELALTRAGMMSARVVAPTNTPLIDVQLAAARAAWQGFQSAIDTAMGTFPALSDTDVAYLKERINALDESAFVEFNNQVAMAPQTIPLLPIGRVAEAFRLSAAAIDKMYRANVALNSTGVLVSLCSPHSTRRLALDVAGDFWQANSRTDFANDHSIRLITILPGLSFRVLRNPRWDFLDAGAGAGRYWFSSRGFDTFGGWVVQAGRLDVRGPSRWANAGGLKQLAAFVTFRAGLTVFVHGFAADVFQATGDAARRIPTEAKFTKSIYINLTPLLRHPRGALTFH